MFVLLDRFLSSPPPPFSFLPPSFLPPSLLFSHSHWLDLLHLCDQYLKENLGVLGDMNVVTVKMRECLLDSYIGECCRLSQMLVIIQLQHL